MGLRDGEVEIRDVDNLLELMSLEEEHERKVSVEKGNRGCHPQISLFGYRLF